ncbi:uncharacterized protein [Dermacentor albipictus]|uniref:uncharacterized protein n=1 Tax=Dermacentor albipictus TaxID=60249 RepID=UPI0038FC9C51
MDSPVTPVGDNPGMPLGFADGLPRDSLLADVTVVLPITAKLRSATSTPDDIKVFATAPSFSGQYSSDAGMLLKRCLFFTQIAAFGSSLSPSSTCATSTSLSNFLLDPPLQAADNSVDYLSMEDVIIFKPVSSGTRTLPPAAALQRSDLSNWHQQGASSGHGRAATMRSLLSSPFCFLVQPLFNRIWITSPLGVTPGL